MLTPADFVFATNPWEDYIRPFAIDVAKKEMARRELARRDLLEYMKYFNPDFIVEPFQVHICERIMVFLNAIIAGEDPCIIIEAPPRHGKSFICSENLPSFAIGYLSLHIPKTKLLHLGYNQTFITDFGRINRDRLRDYRYINLFPNQEARPDVAGTSHVETLSQDIYHVAGMGSAITGYGAHLLIIDDPVKGSEDADSEKEVRKQIDRYQTDISTRAMDRCGKLIMMTRWSNMDIAGYVQEKARQNPEADQWEVLKFPAIATDNDILGRKPGDPLCPRRFPLKRLRKDRAGKSAKAWSALYQQNPVPETGGFFEASDIEACVTPLSKYPDIAELNVYISGDFAIGTKAKNDFTVFWPFGIDKNNHIWFLNDLCRFKGGGNQIVSDLLRLAKKYRALTNMRGLILEDGHIYRALRDSIKQRMLETGHVYFIDAPYPTKDKVARAEPLRARIQQHMVHFPDTEQFKDIVFKEFMAFGEDSVGVHDDTVDAAATGVMRLSHLRAWRKSGVATPTAKGPTDIADMNMDQIKALHNKQSYHRGRRNTRARVPSTLNGQTRLTKKPRRT